MRKIKLFKPYVSWTAVFNAVRTLRSGQLAEGPRVKEFETKLSGIIGSKNVLTLNSGTTALELAYELSGLGAGDEVITTVLTCTATNIPLVRRGVQIIFADIDRDLNVSIEDVLKKITPRTKAIVFVHFGGNNRGLSDLLDICKKKNIVLIEDAAQAFGTDFFGKADFTALSLQAIKTLTSGDGGVLISRNEEDHKKAKRLRWFGYDRDLKQKLGDTDLLEAGYKYHMNDVCAAIGLGNLKAMPKVLAHREMIAKIYRSYGMFAHMWLAGGFVDDYRKIKDAYAVAGYEIGQHHYRNDKYTLFKKFKTSCPMMDELEYQYFFVPFHYGVSKKDAHKIGKMYQEYKKNKSQK